MNVNRREIYRYLGVKRGEPDDSVKQLVEECLREIQEVMTPRSFHLTFPMKFLENGDIDITCFTIHSKSLQKNLKGCEKVILFAATIGEGVDLLIRRYSKLEMSRGVVMQAASAAVIEAYCNELNENFKNEAAKEGYFLRPRFSPGYGDFSIEYQALFSDVLKMQKTCGITLTDSYLMMPSKSVTAIIGMSRTNAHCATAGCESCRMAETCAYRR